MKKSFLLLPVIALSLAACTTTPTAGVEDVVGPATVDGSWQNNDVNQGVYQPDSQVYQPEMQVYQPEPQVNEPVSQPVATTLDIPRDINGKPDYDRIVKGSYTGNTYKVQKGDTLFLVSYLSGQDRQTIARLNNLRQPYTLFVGQVIRLK